MPDTGTAVAVTAPTPVEIEARLAALASATGRPTGWG